MYIVVKPLESSNTSHQTHRSSTIHTKIQNICYENHSDLNPELKRFEVHAQRNFYEVRRAHDIR